MPEKILQLRENGAVRAMVHVLRKQHRIDLVTLPIAVIVADVEDGAGIHPVGQQQVDARGLVKRVVLRDVTEQQPVRELIRRQQTYDLDVKLLVSAAGIHKAARRDTEIRLKP